jgi:hypothetical protein
MHPKAELYINDTHFNIPDDIMAHDIMVLISWRIGRRLFLLYNGVRAHPPAGSPESKVNGHE